MPNECSYCGEFKLCRMESMEPLGVGNCFHWIAGRLESYNWVCEDCDKARSIIRNEERLAETQKQKIHQAIWIKERDKLLKENNRRVCTK